MKLKPTAIVVVLFLILFVWWGSSRAEGQVELGAAQVGTNFSNAAMLTLTDRINDKYDLTIGYISNQRFSVCDRPDCTWNVKTQIFVGGEYLVTSPWTDKLRLGLGPYYFQRQDRIGTSNFRMGLSIEYRLNERFGLRARHFSNAGSGPNITICRDEFGCLTNDWNTGQDSWLRGVWYF